MSVFLSCANIEVVIDRKTAYDKQSRETLRQARISDPTNLDAANRYWDAVGVSQSGRYVIEAFRSAALTSHAGLSRLHAHAESSCKIAAKGHVQYFSMRT